VGAPWTKGQWVNGIAEWTDEAARTAYLSIVFTWKLDEAWTRACWYRAQGYHVRAGGPGIFTRKHYLADVAEIAAPGEKIPDALVRHNPMATKASEGCPVGCWFCIVPAMEGRAFTLLPDFTPRPVLTDNNLSALPADYQRHIVARYLAADAPLLDANSGFEPKTFDEEVFERWRPINRGVWRFAYDETPEGADVYRVCQMLRQRGVSSRNIQVYVLIGNEPIAECMRRILQVIEWGGEPYVQPVMKLNALTKEPWVRHNWTAHGLKKVQRWANRHLWRKTRFEDYDASIKTNTPIRLPSGAAPEGVSEERASHARLIAGEGQRDHG
jgi:hypothetical protein